MRILLLSSTKYPHIGGQSVHMKKLGDAFVKLGHEVDYLSPSDMPPLLATTFEKSTAWVRRLTGPWLWVIFYLYGLTRMMSYLATAKINERDYQVVHPQDPLAMIWMHRRSGVTSHSLFLTVHGYFAYESVGGRARQGSFMWSYLQKLESKAYHSADLIFAVDQGIKEYIRSFGVESDRIVVLRNFIDTGEFSPTKTKEECGKEFGIDSSKFVVLCPRRLVRKCGAIYAARAAKHLREHLGDNFLLLFAGEGSERKRIARFARENDLEKNIVLMGEVQHEKMPTLIRGADAVVIPSVSVGIEREATSISALEAMASAVPVVASDIGGLSELITNNETGYLVRERDSKALAEALLNIANEDQSTIIRNAMEEVTSNYSHIERAREFLRYYENVMSDSKKTRLKLT